MFEYPASPFTELTVSGGGFLEFSDLFFALKSRWVTVEFQQHYDETGEAGYDAFKAGQLDRVPVLARELVLAQKDLYAHAQEFNVEMIRIRVVTAPLSDYLDKFERYAYLADIEMGEKVYVVDRQAVQQLAGTAEMSDYLLFDQRKVVSLIYDDKPLGGARLQAALLCEDGPAVEGYEQLTDAILEQATPFMQSEYYW